MNYKKIMLAISFLGLLVALFALFQDFTYSNPPNDNITTIQKSNGDLSPNINGVDGNVDIK